MKPFLTKRPSRTECTEQHLLDISPAGGFVESRATRHTRPSPSPCSALRGWTSAAPILVVRSHQGPPPITSPSITPKPIHLPTPQIPDNRFYPPLCPYLTPSRHNEEPHHPPPAPPPTPRLPPMGLGWGLPKPPLQVSLLIGEIQQAAFCFAGGKYASALTSSQCNFRSSTLIH